LVYSLVAVVLGVLAVMVPLFLTPALGTGFEARFAPMAVQERIKSLEELYGLGKGPVQGCLAGLLTLMVGFAAAITAYFIIKARL